MNDFVDAYNFSACTASGFNAKLTLLDDYTQPITVTGFSANMILNVVNTNNNEFLWSSASANIRFEEPGKMIITVPPSSCVPKTFINNPEQYPYQIYTYTLAIIDNNKLPYLSISGLFTIYMNG